MLPYIHVNGFGAFKTYVLEYTAYYTLFYHYSFSHAFPFLLHILALNCVWTINKFLIRNTKKKIQPQNILQIKSLFFYRYRVYSFTVYLSFE